MNTHLTESPSSLPALLLQYVNIAVVHGQASRVRDHPHVRAVPAGRDEGSRQAHRVPAWSDADIGTGVDGV